MNGEDKETFSSTLRLGETWQENIAETFQNAQNQGVL